MIHFPRRLLVVFASVFSLFLWIGSSFLLPSNSWATPVDPKLEAQVLEIIRKNPEVIIESLQAYQAQQQAAQEQQQQAFLQQMKGNPASVIGESPTFGASQQDVVMLMFSDFQCPFCAKAHQTVKTLMDKHRDRVTFVFKHLPLVQIHPQAYPAALAAWAANQQGKFWQYHDALFDHQDQLGEDLYLQTARRLGLNLEQFNRDRASDAAKAAIAQDIDMAQTLAIRGTPFFAINGQPIPGAVDLEEFEAVLAQVMNP